MYTVEDRVKISDCDASGLLTPLSMLRMMGDCSQFWTESEPKFDEWLDGVDHTMVITSRQMDVFFRPAFGERLKIETRIYKMKSMLGYRNTCIYTAAGEMVAAAWGVGAFIDMHTGKAVRVPKDIIESLTIDEKVEMEYASHRIEIADEGGIAAEPVKVTRSMLDFNKHMNNAQYARVASDLMEDSFTFNRLRMEFRSQARYGQQVYPVIFENGSNRVIDLRDEEGNAFTTVSFETVER